MKVLLIGMDGAHIDVFDRGWTPHTSSIIKKGTQIAIRNDLISRGWLEIVTGKHASVTGAMYDNPKANATYEWNLKFSINDIPGINHYVKPIWQVLSEKEYRVGIMNVPTVYPAPKVNGFFISGGGGGGPVVEKATPELCYPEETLTTLQKNDYIVDERIVQLVVEKKLDTPSLIFEELAKKNNKRTTSFIELAKNYNIDFGFVVYKTSSVTAETILAPEWTKVENNAESIDEETVNALKVYYQSFDHEIKRLQDAFPEAEMIFVSDHGTITRTHTVNLNIFLQNYNFQSPLPGKGLKKALIEYAKKVIPFSLKVKLQKLKPIKSAIESVATFDTAISYAFSHTKNDWTHGIFINDEKRFKGPVLEKDIDKIRHEIIQAFNSDPTSQQHGLFAHPVNKNPENSINYFPDIIVTLPSGYLTNNASNEFVKKFSRPNGVSSLSSVLRGDIIAMKSHEPLAVDCGKNAHKSKQAFDGRDLTAIYDLVLKKFDINRNSI